MIGFTARPENMYVRVASLPRPPIPHPGWMEPCDLAAASSLISIPLCCFMRAHNAFVAPRRVVIYDAAGAMPPSVDESVVALRRDDVGPRVPGVPRAPEEARRRTAPHLGPAKPNVSFHESSL